MSGKQVHVQKWKARSVSVPQTARGRWKFSDTRKDVLANKLMLPLSFLLSPLPPKVVRQTCTRLQSLSHSVSGIRQPFSLSDVCPASLPRDVCCCYGWIPPSSGHSVYSTNAKVPLSLSHSIVDGCLPKIAHLSILPPPPLSLSLCMNRAGQSFPSRSFCRMSL